MNKEEQENYKEIRHALELCEILGIKPQEYILPLDAIMRVSDES